jgi:hypothetical protein
VVLLSNLGQILALILISRGSFDDVILIISINKIC